MALSITGQLANPVYGGMLSQGIAGGMQGISDAYAKRRENNAFDSISTMLTQADPDDPNVQQSVLAVARQTGVDPLKAQELIYQAQSRAATKRAEGRAIEGLDMARKRMDMAVEQQDWSRVNQAFRVFQQQEEMKNQKAQQEAIGQFMKNPDSIDAYLAGVPDANKAAAMEAVNGVRQYQMNREKHIESIKSNQPLSSETLEYYTEMGDATAEAVKKYKKDLKDGAVSPRKAAADLMSIAQKQLERQLYVSQAKKSTATERDVNLAKSLVDTVVSTPGDTWVPLMDKYSEDEKESAKLQVSYQVAQAFKETGVLPGKAEIQSLYEKILGEQPEAQTDGEWTIKRK